MSVKLHHKSFGSSSSSNPWLSQKPTRTRYFNKRVVDLDHLLFRCYSKKRCRIKLSLLEDGNLSLNFRSVNLRKHYLTFCKSKRIEHLMPFASADDGVTINGSPQPSTSSDVDEMRVKLGQSLQGGDYYTGLVQTLHDAARIFELAIKEQSSLSKLSWFSPAWLGVDKNSWVKALSYQASVYSLLQAGSEILSRGDGRERDINVFVQRSLLRQSVPLESEIREKLLAKQPEAYEWFWSVQVPAVVTSFVNYFEKDQSYAAATTVWGKGISLYSGNASDKSLLMLALSCIAAITKLGPAKVSCAQFFSTIPDVTGRLMDMLVEFIPIRQAYHSIKDTGLSREFLVHFGPRAAACRVKNDGRNEEVAFWVGLVQNQLQRAIDRERIWSRLTTSESLEVLDRDLAVFGFFIALGRSTQSFLYASGFEVVDEPIEGFIRNQVIGNIAETSVMRIVSRKEPDSFDKALESVEEAMIRLEELLQELHVSSSSSGKEHLKAACSDLERIRKLKKEAEFLEVSFRTKAASLQQVDGDNPLRSSLSKQRQYSIGKGSKSANIKMDRRSRVVSSIGRLWSFIILWPSRKSDPESSIADGSEDELFESDTVNMGVADSKSNEILGFLNF